MSSPEIGLSESQIATIQGLKKAGYFEYGIVGDAQPAPESTIDKLISLQTVPDPNKPLQFQMVDFYLAPLRFWTDLYVSSMKFWSNFYSLQKKSFS